MKYIILWIVFISSFLLFPLSAEASSLDYATATRVELLNEILSLKKELIDEKNTIIELRKTISELDLYINLLAPHYTEMFSSIAILQQQNHYLRQLTNDLWQHPFQPLDIAISLQINAGTGIVFSPIAKMYFWDGFYGYIGGTVLYDWTGHSNYSIPFAFQAGAGLGYDFYWRW